jgi:hypothetical protein
MWDGGDGGCEGQLSHQSGRKHANISHIRFGEPS